MKRAFKVEACWDEEAKVWYSVSDINGLHIEADTLEEFEVVLFEVAPELIVCNHIRPQDLVKRTMAELVPAILWQRPQGQLECA